MLKNHSFSLIQYLITLLIISLLTTLAFPSYRQKNQQQLMLSASKQLHHYLTYAKILAITNYTTITIELLPYSSPCQLIIKNPQQIVKIYYFPKTLSISWHGFGTSHNKIIINANGLSNNNGHFIINHKQNHTLHYTLVVSKTLKLAIKSN